MSDKKIVKMDYPSNSHKEKDRTEDREPVNKIISGTAVQQKKTVGRKLADVFVGEDVGNVRQYLFNDVLIPAAKNTLSEMVSSGIDMLLFGQKQSRNTTRTGNRSVVNYSSISESRRNHAPQSRSIRARTMQNFGDIRLSSRGEAEDVLSLLVDFISDYGMATVADLYDMVGITSEFTDNKYGWVNLSKAEVRITRDGYILDLPVPHALD